MVYLEEKMIVHRDLCADRVMISDDGKAKVSDDVIKWNHFPRYWPFVRGIHWPLVMISEDGKADMYIVVTHYSDVIMSVMASQITGVSIVYSTVVSDADQRKHQSSASLAFVRGIHWWPVNSPHKRPVTRKMFSFDDVHDEILNRSGMWVMKPISAVSSFSQFIRIIKTPVTYWISRSYLTCVAETQLEWHLSNMVLNKYNGQFYKIGNFPDEEITKRGLSNPQIYPMTPLLILFPDLGLITIETQQLWVKIAIVRNKAPLPWCYNAVTMKTYVIFKTTWDFEMSVERRSTWLKKGKRKLRDTVQLIARMKLIMMTSSNGNIFRVTDHLCGEFTGQWWIPRTHKGQWRWALMFSLICAWMNGWVNYRAADDLRRHRTHYDVTVMYVIIVA